MIVLAALAGALGAPRARAAGAKTSTNSVIVDDLTAGSGGIVHAVAGASELDGSLGQVSQIVELSAGATVEAGFFAALVSTPNAPAYVQVNGSSVSIQWLDAIPPNPSGTAYTLDASTDSGFGGILVSSSAYGLSGVVPGLKGNTTYYARVRAAYSESDDSLPVSLGQTVTQALAPSAGSFADVAPFVLRAAWDPLSNSVGDLAGAWSALVSTLPASRQGHAMVYYGGRLYVSGGADPTPQSAVYTAPVLADGTIGAWAATTPLPAIRESHAMAAWAGRLYAAGGSDGSARATVWWAPIRSDGSVGDWAATTPLPGARTQLAMTASAGRLVVAGGDNGISAQSTVYSAAINDDGSVGAWTAAAALPAPVSGHAMAVSSATLYIAGGASGGAVSTVWWTALTAGAPGAWTATTPLPTALTRHAMAAANGKLYVAGGSDGTTVLGAVYVGQLQSDGTVAGWVSQAAIPALFKQAMAASMDALYVTGGSNGGAPTNGTLSAALGGTQSLAELSSLASFAPVLSSSSWRSGTNFDFSGLTPNTTYFSRVSARNYAGVQTGLLALGSTMTLAAVPVTAASTFTDVEIGSMTFQWASGGNPAGTEYAAQASTAADFSGTVLTGGWLTATTTGFSGLAVNTSYYLRVQSRNALHVASPFAPLGSTYTLAVPPTGSAIASSTASGLTLVWGPSSNPPGTLFEAQVSSMTSFIPLLQSSVTLAASAAFSSLVSASTFYARVRALNGDGAPSGFDAVVSTATGLDAVAPGGSTGTFAYPGAAADSLTAGWVVPGDNGYAGALFAGTSFYVQWSTSDPASVVWSTASAQFVASTGPIAPGGQATVAIAGLPDRKQVYLREWTRDLAGNYSAPTATFSAVTTPFSYEALAGGGGFDAGTSPSLAADKAGNLHAAYRGTTGTQELQYAKRTPAGAWGGAITLDPGVVASNVILALDAADNPVIAYRDASASQLKVARFSGSWTISVVESGNFAPGGAAVDAAGAVHISYYDAAAKHLKFARSTGVSWSTQTVDNSAADTGLQSALALDSSQQPYISYYDATNAALKFASATAGGVWSLQTVEAGVALSTGCVLALDGDSRAHIAYADAAGNAVKYASMTAGGWSVRVVESASGLGGLRVGMALDGAGAAHLSYGDRAAGTLKYAQWTGAAFSTQTIDASADEGLESSLALDGAGNVHIAYRDATAKAFKAAHWTGAALPAPFGGNARGRAQAPSGMAGAALSTTSVQWSWTDNASNELGFRLYGSLVSTGPFALVAGTATIAASPSAGGIVSYTETGLTAGTTYYRYAVAVGTGGAAASAAAGAYPANVADAVPPSIVNNQTGDAVLRRLNSGTYNVNFFDTGGSHLSSFAVKASTVPGGAGPDLIAFTTVASSIGLDSYSAAWPLPAAVFNSLLGGVTNYITVKVVDGAGNAATGTDLFYVLRDTSVPSISGHVVQVSSQGITAVEVDCFDAAGSLRSTAFTQADGSGTYVLNGVPVGTFRVQASWLVNGVGNSVWIDSIPVDTTNLDFVLQLNFNLAAVQGNLATLSTTPNGPSSLRAGSRAASFFDPKALPSPTLARVELYQANRQVGMVPVPPNGHWIIPNLLPGTYSLRAYNGIAYTEFQTVDLIDGEIKSIGFLSSPLPNDQVFAFPNPARRSTTFRFQSALLPLEAQIRVFDLAGGLVKELSTAGGQIQAAFGSGPGVYHADWDLTNNRGEGAASGVYLFSVKVNGGNSQSALVTKKLAVVK